VFSLTGYSGNSSGTNTNQPSNVLSGIQQLHQDGGGARHQVRWRSPVAGLQQYQLVELRRFYTFDAGTWVKATGTAATPTSGGSMAQFLLGLPTSGSYAINSPYKADAYYDALFFQDDWHIRPNVTLNLGLRWEHAHTTTEGHNRQTVAFNPSAVNQVTQAAEAAYAKSPSALLPVSAFAPHGRGVFATSGQRSAYDTSDKSFAPRVGVAWSAMAQNGHPLGNRYFLLQLWNGGSQQPGYTATTSYVPTNNSYLTPAQTLSNPFPSGIQQPVGSSQGYHIPTSARASPSNNTHFLTNMACDGISTSSRQLSANTSLEVAYIGNHRHHLTTSVQQRRSCRPGILSTSPFRDNDNHRRAGRRG